MTDTGFVQTLDVACGAFLLTAVIVLWRRELAAIIKLFAIQGVALTGIVMVLAIDEGSPELGVIAAGILVLRAGVLPYLVSRAADVAVPPRETRPLVNVAASLLAAAGLTLLAYAIAQPLVDLAPSPAARALPVGLAVVL